MKKGGFAILSVLLGILSSVSAVFAQFEMGSPLGVSNFVAGNITVAGTLIISVVMLTIFIEMYLKKKGYGEYLGGPKIPASICSILIILFMIGGYVPAVLDAAPILGALFWLVGFWYLGMIGISFMSTKLGETEREEERAAKYTALSLKNELQRIGAPGGAEAVQEIDEEIKVINELTALKDDCEKARDIKAMERINEIVDDQKVGLRIETIILTMYELLGSPATPNSVVNSLKTAIPQLEQDKILEDKEDVKEILEYESELRSEINRLKGETAYATKGSDIHNQIARRERELKLLERARKQILKEEQIDARGENIEKQILAAEERRKKQIETEEKKVESKGGL